MEEFYKQLDYDCKLCAVAQRKEREKINGEKGSLAEQRAVELNTYLTIFQNIRDLFRSGELSDYSAEEVIQIMEEAEETRERFLCLLTNSQYTGRTGEVYAELNKKEYAGPA